MKQIGLLLKVDTGNVTINDRYMHWVSQFGNVQFINPLDENVYDLDLLILPGGSDVDPARYGEKPKPYCQKPNIFDEWFDKFMLPKYIAKQIPIFGICRGFQTLAVHFGVKLTQHLYAPYSDPRGKLVENLEFNLEVQPSDRAYNIAKMVKKGSPVKVNSLHHQGFYQWDCEKNPMIQILATAKEALNVEVFKVKDMPICAVQYHPEEIACNYAEALVKSLLTK